MAKQFGSQVDHQKIPILGIVPESGGTGPSSPVNGQLWYDTTNLQLKYWNGTAWTVPGAGAGGPPTGAAGGDLAGSSYPNPVIANGAVTSAKILDGTITTADLAFTPIQSGGAASGDLTGTYPGPTIATGAVTSAKIADGTITDTDVAAANKDGTAGVPSLRTIGTGAQQAMAGNTRLDTITAPTGSVSLNSQKITNLLDPTNPQEGATKNYVDNTAQGLDAKQSVQCATTANITLSGLQAIDGYTTLANDRVLVKNQTTASANGIYVAASGAWTRATDMDVWAEFPSAFTFVEQGTTNADTGWVCTNDAGGTLNTTSVTWTQFSGAGSITAGAGLTQSGTTINAVAGDTSLVVNADELHVNTAVIASVASLASYVPTSRLISNGTGITGGGDLSANRTLAVDTTVIAPLASPTFTGDPKAPTASPGDNDTSIATTAFVTAAVATKATKVFITLPAMSAGVEQTVTHNLNTSAFVCSFSQIASGVGVELAWRVIDVNTLGVTPDIAYAASALRAVVIG